VPSMKVQKISGGRKSPKGGSVLLKGKKGD